ncbi:DUF2798 domain-containing protein [Methylophilus aquaticus]|uniref:DUF2798 domain-containing protein n=1 Tax=Methylophilus aquaticus TaxID=1971610 RepID=A0ABT9JTF5_9PROT|nr:DUF2798 domain-containing protein [Methylophilus aquaticus]MDP8567400.1 DUF2798 domain-containing protein [Methylophilus aquaticus]
MHLRILKKGLFAALMSLVTVNIVCLAILLNNHVASSQFFDKWLHSLLIAWPTAFVCILLIAPLLLRWLDTVIPEQ